MSEEIVATAKNLIELIRRIKQTEKRSDVDTEPYKAESEE